MYTHFRETIRY